MAKRLMLPTFLVTALLALAGAADAEKGRDDEKGEKPERGDKGQKHARDGDAPEKRRDRAPPAPAPGPTPPPPSEAPPSAAPLERASVAVEPAALAHSSHAQEGDGVANAHPIAVLAPSLDEASFSSSAGAVGVRATSAPTGVPIPGARSPGEAPWWLPLAWALPIVGAGGVAAVLVARKHRLRVSVTVSRPRMSPVTPFDVQGLLANGQAAAARGAYDEAVAWFDRVVRIAPGIGVAYFCKGVCLAANGKIAQAYGALRVAVEHEPADPSYRVHFARVALALGKHKEAMDALELVVRAMPDLGPSMLEDPQLADLRDHPRFLMICGAL